MSQWTHVNAIIRFDALRMIPGMGELPDFSGEPTGSEGPIEYQIWENPNDHAMAAYTVSFWGDLRDYDDSDEILTYFKRLTTGKIIRSAILEIDIEYAPAQVYRFFEDVWVKIL